MKERKVKRSPSREVSGPADDRKFRRELSSGTTALALLSILERASEPMYGYSIAKRIDGRGGGAGLIKHGSLYPVLRSLERAGLLKGRVKPSVSGPPRKYYSITTLGSKTLKRWIVIWNETAAFIEELIGGVSHE